MPHPSSAFIPPPPLTSFSEEVPGTGRARSDLGDDATRGAFFGFCSEEGLTAEERHELDGEDVSLALVLLLPFFRGTALPSTCNDKI
jgi:hypothetical protein